MESVNLFIDMIQLETVTANGKFSSLMGNLDTLSFSDDFLRDHLLSITCVGVMFGTKSGVAKL